MSTSPRFPVVFDEDRCKADLVRLSERGRKVLLDARAHITVAGGLSAQDGLRACAAEGRDGTRLAGCGKLYLPPPAGPYRMVLELRRFSGEPVLAYVAFGVSHHPPESNARTVYEISARPAPWEHAAVSFVLDLEIIDLTDWCRSGPDVKRGRYRWRTALRRRLPKRLVDLGVAGKGRGDCGAHEFYNADGTIEQCYHCEVGRRPYDPKRFSSR